MIASPCFLFPRPQGRDDVGRSAPFMNCTVGQLDSTGCGHRPILAGAMKKQVTSIPMVDYPLVNIQKAIEHGPFIVDLPIESGDFP